MNREQITWNLLHAFYEAWPEFKKSRRGISLDNAAAGYGPGADLCGACISDLIDAGLVTPLLGGEGAITEEGRTVVSRILSAPVESRPAELAVVMKEIKLR